MLDAFFSVNSRNTWGGDAQSRVHLVKPGYVYMNFSGLDQKAKHQ